MSTSPASVQRHLRGISYPADLEDLVAQAEENDAPAEVMAAIESLEERTYDGPEDVSDALGDEDDDE
jgi:hypothetical protein